MQFIETHRGIKRSAQIVLDNDIYEVLFGNFKRNAHNGEEFVLNRAQAPQLFKTLTAAQNNRIE